MSFILRLNGTKVSESRSWNPNLFGDILKTSLPREVAQSYRFDNGNYVLQWEDDPLPTPEEQAAAAAIAARDAADDAAHAVARGDSVIQYLRDHTPAEVENYIQTNVTDLASARNLLKKFGVALCVLAKRNFR